jgi:DNA-binding MarR family transcriptional regulator
MGDRVGNHDNGQRAGLRGGQVARGDHSTTHGSPRSGRRRCGSAALTSGVNLVGSGGDAGNDGKNDEHRVNLGVSLFIPYRYTEDRIFRALKDTGFDDWTLAQCRVFQRVAPEGSRLTDLAEQAQMSKQSAGVLVDQLERLGYVRRVPDPTDGRARLIVIEPRGRRAVDVATATLDEILSEWKAYLGTRNFTLLHQILDQLGEITDPYTR